MDISAIAVQGLQQAGESLNQAATRIASANALAQTNNADAVDLSSQLVNLLQAQHHYDLGLATLKVAGQVQKVTLDVKG